MVDIKSTDIIAIVILIGCFILLGLGVDSTVTELLRAVAFFYFGAKIGKAAANKNVL